jgi:hypothetical protein
MKKLMTIALLIACITISCQTKKEESTADTTTADSAAVDTPPVTLTLKWETEPAMTTCESVLYDKDRDVVYVSNIDGDPGKKDGNGFISKIALDGKITEAKWVAKGLDAPKGLGLIGTKLYVTDIDRVHEIDVTSGKITKTYKVDGAQFLNDITTDASGKIYVSDSNTGTISLIENGKVSKWMENVQGGPNGLLAEPNQILMLTFQGQVLSTIDPATKQVTSRVEGIENGDGIEPVGDGSYLTSSWNGLVTYVGSDWKKTIVLDTRADSVNAADIEYIQEKNLLLVPGFFKNKVMAYEVKKK